MVLPLLDVVPNKLICHPGCLFSGQLRILKAGIVADGKALTAIAADNRLCRSSVGAML